MGWLIYPSTPGDIKAEIFRICTGPTITPLKAMKVGSTWYVAIQNNINQSVFAAVILTSTKNGEWGYKDLTEDMGPNEDKCPVTILNLLTPTNDPLANEWRERCRANLKTQNIPIGSVVRLHESWEPYGIAFKKVIYPRSRGVYQSVKTGSFVRLRRDQIKEVISK